MQNCISCGNELEKDVHVDRVGDPRMVYVCECGEEFEACDNCENPVFDGEKGRFKDKHGSGGKPKGHPDYGYVTARVCTDCELWEGLADDRKTYDRRFEEV